MSTEIDGPRDRWVWVVITIAILGLVPLGFKRWDQFQHERLVRATLLDFTQALQSGDQLRVVEFFTPEYRRTNKLDAIIAKVPKTDAFAADDVAIYRLKVQQDTATAELAIYKDTYALKPKITLTQTEPRVWRITRIDGLQPDPRWLQGQQQTAIDIETELIDHFSATENPDLPQQGHSP